MRIRPLAVALALAGAAVLGPAALPAAAHGDNVLLDVTGQEGGHVTTVATFENDHEPVVEEFAGTLAATSADGRSAGPWRLVAVPGHPGSYTTREILPAGHWRITVDCAFPSLGHGEREMDVEAAAIVDPVLPTPPTTTSGPATPGPSTTTAPTTTIAPTAGPTVTASATPTVTAAPTPSAQSAGKPVTSVQTPQDEKSTGTSAAATWAAIGTAAAAVVVVATGFWLRRRSRRL
ncbi:hypothetical protein J5Y04_07370 [Kitasatospora sp. RG8]|uniref:hypothetical protein n=1 Tax=Kitasatospora sp. RG8 TaxID=2820815 RepID=UPI001ADF6600|nr:hypothetical protein [Kitasatospora sp. RG8]MBP0449371.1 hypothetical protein [Kitasatospora sp. RG8]